MMILVLLHIFLILVYGVYAFNNQFDVNGEADYLSLTIGDIKGRILAFNITGFFNCSI